MTDQRKDRDNVTDDEDTVRLWLRVPAWLKKDLARAAAERGVSANQAGLFLIAYGLRLFEEEDADLQASLEAARKQVHVTITHEVFSLAELRTS